jgi:hypothetical protein
LALLGKPTPKSVKVVACLVFAEGSRDGIHHVAAGVESFRRPLDGSAFASGIPSLEYENHWTFLEINLIAELAKLNLAARNLANVGFAL